MMATSLSSPLSLADISKQIKELSKELPDQRADAARLDSLRRLFTQLESDGELVFGIAPPQNSTETKWRAFLMQTHKRMVSQLCERVRMERHASLRCLFGLVAGSPVTHRVSSKTISSKKCDDTNSEIVITYKLMNTQLLKQWIKALIQRETNGCMDRGMKHMVEAEFFGPYRDVQYYSLGCIAALATEAYNKRSHEKEEENDDEENKNGSDHHNFNDRIGEKLMELLMLIPVPVSEHDLEEKSQYLIPLPANVKHDQVEEDCSVNDEIGDDDDDDDFSNHSNDEESDASIDDSARPRKRPKMGTENEQLHKFPFQRMRSFRREYLKAWLAVLRFPLPVASLKQALQYLPNHVLNYVSNPLRFADFFMEAYSDHDSGLIGVLALDGLFLLMTQHGLEYPNFYKQLYKLISSKVLNAKFRVRFFTLLTKCLMRNEMLPAHLVAAFVKRLCRIALSGPTPSVLFVLALVSNLLRKHPECSCLLQRKDDSEIEDMYVPDQDDPEQCRALHSSLWELAVLERHYYPAVATLAKSIGRPEEDNTPLYVFEDFVGHTYGSLFSQEKKRKSKTALAFHEPASLFSDDDVFAGSLKVGSNDDKSSD